MRSQARGGLPGGGRQRQAEAGLACRSHAAQLSVLPEPQRAGEGGGSGPLQRRALSAAGHGGREANG